MFELLFLSQTDDKFSLASERRKHSVIHFFSNPVLSPRFASQFGDLRFSIAGQQPEPRDGGVSTEETGRLQPNRGSSLLSTG